MLLSITGSREGLTDWQRAALRRVLRRPSLTGIVHGDCVGADAEADAEAKRVGLACFAFPSNAYHFRAHTKNTGTIYLAEPAPPLQRNRAIVEYGQVCVGLPRQSSRGTWHAIWIARELWRPLLVLGEDRVLTTAAA